MKKTILALITGCIFLLLWSCSDDITDAPKGNIPPETDIFIQSADTLNLTPSVQTIYWDGSDADGFVVGFYYTWADNPAPADWVFTTKRSQVFPLEISGSDTAYTFQVKSVDDDGAEDTTPARQLFPIKNSPPVIKFPTISKIPDTTFNVASFLWEVTDLDGDTSIRVFEYALDDTTQWRQIAGFRRSITLNADSGLTVGDHAFYIRAVDIAGATSSTIRMPDNPARFWHVKEPIGRYLLIDDFQDESSSGFPDAYYRAMMENVVVPQGEAYSTWNIETLFPASSLQFSATLLLFDYVIWYTDVSKETDPHFVAAQLAVPDFLNNGGKIVYTTMFDKGFGSQGNPLAFTPVDTLAPTSGIYRSLPGSLYEPDADFSTIFPNIQLPVLKVSRFIPAMKALGPKASAIPVYRSNALGPSTGGDLPIFMVLGKNDNTGEHNFLFSGAPLHQLQANNNLDDFFNIILNEIFN